MRNLKFFFLVPCILAFLASCSSSKADGDYTASDYADMVDYMYEAIEELEVINRTADPSDIQHTRYLCQQVINEYPDAKEYLQICTKAMAEENPKLLEKASHAKLSQVMDCAARGWFNQW